MITSGALLLLLSFSLGDTCTYFDGTTKKKTCTRESPCCGLIYYERSKKTVASCNFSEDPAETCPCDEKSGYYTCYFDDAIPNEKDLYFWNGRIGSSYSQNSEFC